MATPPIEPAAAVIDLDSSFTVDEPPRRVGRGDLRRLWTHRWRLIGVTAAILAPMLTVLFALSLLDAGDSATIENGTLYNPPAGYPWIWAAAVAIGWSYAVAAETAVAGGALRDRSVRPGAVMRAAAMAWPYPSLPTAGSSSGRSSSTPRRRTRRRCCASR